MARLYANENFPFPVVAELRRLGHDVLTTSDVGKSDQAIPDEEVLAFACEETRVLLTINRKHFLRLHRATPDHAGIVICTFDPDFMAQAARIHTALEEHPQLTGRLVRVNRPSSN